MSETIYNLIRVAKTNLDNEIKTLESELKEINEKLSSTQKANFSEMKKNWEKLSNAFGEAMSNIFAGKQEETDHILTRLKESLLNQMGGFGEYATNILGEQEQHLVNINETSLSNIKDITQSHLDMLSALILQISSVANDAVSKSIAISKEKEENIKSEITKVMALHKDELKGSVTTLQDEFRVKIGDQIETVYVGISKTKEGINEIIKDTLSRLEENLLRLTDGIDTNFASEVGETQNLIHRYEGKLLKAIEAVHSNYEGQTTEIITRQTALAKENLMSLESTLNEQKEQILSQINDLSTDQQKLVNSAILQLEEEVNQSKSKIIGFMGDLKDQIQSAVNNTRQSTNEQIKELQQLTSKVTTESLSEVKSSGKSLNEQIKGDVDNWSKQFEDNLKSSKKGSEESIKKIKNALGQFESDVKREEKN